MPLPANWGVFCDFAVALCLSSMARRLHNWSYRDVTTFLKKKGFELWKQIGGSHAAWKKKGDGKKPDRLVEVNFTHGNYPVGTMKTMIRQSGIDQKVWIKR